MSGGQIGTVVGGAIGAYFGGTVGMQIGMAVGGYIGGAIDPTKIYGPHIGDGQQQTSTDGSPIAWIQGRARIAGCIVDVTDRREVKKTDSGKGSGTEQVSYEAHQDFIIQVCESSELRGTVVTGVVRIEMDGKVVYDGDPASPIHKDSLIFRQGVDFLFGGEEQLPHPTFEAFHGVGNTLAYRGYFCAVFKDFNLTAQGDRIPSFVFTLQASSINAASYVEVTDSFKYLMVDTPDPGPFPPYAPGYDDALWRGGRGGFGDIPELGIPINTTWTVGEPVLPGSTIWLRKPFVATPGVEVEIVAYHDDFGALWVNGHNIYETTAQTTTTTRTIPLEYMLPRNIAVLRVLNTSDLGGHIVAGMAIHAVGAPPRPTDGTITLADVVANICSRGGLDLEFIDVQELVDVFVKGYPIATQSTASDCLSPLLSSYFCYASEYDGVLHFRKLGANAEFTIDPLDLIESDTGNDGASVISNQRNQETEYPRKITTTYYDPDQNYQAVTVTYERNSKDVNAIGEQAFQIPVVLSANDAMAATVKAMKTSWAALEGKAEYSLPLVSRAGVPYIGVAAGDCVFFSGKRWVAEKVTISHNMMHLETTYNRQSAYTNKIQAIPSNPPIPPVSRVGGPTTCYAMNLPSLRTQDQYGIYVAVGGETTAWAGAKIQVSFDGGQSWVDKVSATAESVLGVLSANVAAADTTLAVTVNGEMTTITTEQLAAGGNPYAILSPSDIPEVGQFRVATQTDAEDFTLSELNRGLKGTAAADHSTGDRFTMLDNVYFIPIDLSFGETELQIRAITFGGTAEEAEVQHLVYRPDDQVILDGGGDPL
jgi:hypothetical protein